MSSVFQPYKDSKTVIFEVENSFFLHGFLGTKYNTGYQECTRNYPA